ncbi:hypothetical protein D3C87_1390090 [compost metagenome]
MAVVIAEVVPAATFITSNWTLVPLMILPICGVATAEVTPTQRTRHAVGLPEAANCKPEINRAPDAVVCVKVVVVRLIQKCTKRPILVYVPVCTLYTTLRSPGVVKLMVGVNVLSL